MPVEGKISASAMIFKRFKIHSGILIALIALCVGTSRPSVVFAEDFSSSVTINAKIDPLELTVGDIATYSLVIRHKEGFQFLPPNVSENFSGLNLIDQGTSPVHKEKGWVEQEFWFHLRADQVGLHTLPGPTVKFKAPDVNDPSTLIAGETTAPDVKVTIRSVLYTDGEPEDIRDLKPIVGAGWPWKKYAIPIAAFLLLSYLIGYFTNEWVKRNRITPPTPTPVVIPPDELALRELQQLYKKNYHQTGQVRQLYFELSEIYRRYLGARYDLPALDWTTEEIGQALARHPEFDDPTRKNALQILWDSDLVKFARVEVDADTAVRLMKSARSFVKETSQRETPVTTSNSNEQPTAS